jgi:cytidine deaminase
MLTHGEYEVEKIVSTYKDGKVIPSCGACREFIIHLGKEAENIEMLLDNKGRTIKLIDLLPEYLRYK